MAFTLVADIFAKVDGAITSMVSANVATIISGTVANSRW